MALESVCRICGAQFGNRWIIRTNVRLKLLFEHFLLVILNTYVAALLCFLFLVLPSLGIMAPSQQPPLYKFETILYWNICTVFGLVMRLLCGAQNINASEWMPLPEVYANKALVRLPRPIFVLFLLFALWAMRYVRHCECQFYTFSHAPM